MRKIYQFLLCAMCVLSSCTDDDSMLVSTNNDSKNESSSFIYRRSFNEAVEIANNAINMLEATPASRTAGARRTLNLETGVKTLHHSMSRSGDNNSNLDTLLYVFNFNNDMGFAIVSASRQTEGLIAVIESGTFDPNMRTGNPGFDQYIEMAKSYVIDEDNKTIGMERSGSRASDHPIMCKQVIDTVFYKKVTPLVSVKWGQESRMGQFCPNGTSGCNITAAAQIMSYYKYPQSLTLTYPNRDVNNTILDWTSMCNHIYSQSLSNRDDADIQLGRLARQLGHLSESDYSSGGLTFTLVSNTRSTLQSLGYSIGDIRNYAPFETPRDYDGGHPLAAGLDEGKIIYMYGNNSDNLGHSWIIDGCYYVKAIYKIMATNDGERWYPYYTGVTYRTSHNHINWGWDGAQNGYFLDSVLNARNPYSQDEGEYSIDDNYNRNFYNDIKYFFVWH